MLSRSNTWPVVVRLEDGRLATQLEPLTRLEETPVLEVTLPTPESRKAAVRKAATLYRHYYLEGGWGWAVVAASALVHLLSHGLLLSWGVLLPPTAAKFSTPIIETGQWRLLCSAVVFDSSLPRQF